MSDDWVDTVRLDDAGTKERFELLGEAGSGGMGVVHRARSTKTGALVALKVMSVATGDPARFALETRVLSELHHENIVAYHAHGTTSDGKPYLAMEWIEGETLQAKVEHGALPAAEAVRVARGIAAALVHAHAAGVVHRDLKPSNVLVTKDGAVKLVDFGVARILELGRGLTATGQFVGTAGYMAPEQARDDGPVDGRADLFALGCVLYFMLSGQRPFEGASPEAYLTKLLFEAPVPLRERAPATPLALVELVERLLARDRDARPASAADVLAELETVLDAPPPPRTPAADRTLASPITPSPTAARRPRTGPRRWIALGVVLASAAALGLALGRGSHEEASTSGPEAGSPPSAPPASTVAPGARTVDDLRRACRDWSAALVRTQRDGGAFSGEEHRPPSGWDTAQQLFALARARHACGAPETGVLERGARGLGAYRTDAGWTGLGEHPVAELPATAWAALAGAALERAGVAAPELAQDALALVRAAARPGGGFAFAPGSDRSDRYTSLLATWTLVDAAKDEHDEPARAAAAWLASALATDAVLRETAGLEEQGAFVLSLARRKKLAASDDALTQSLARDLVARCALAGAACTRPLSADDAVPLHGNPDAGDGSLVALWHPWLTLASAELAADESVPLQLRAPVGLASEWARGELTAATAIVAVAPAYKLAEYLIVVTYLLDP